MADSQLSLPGIVAGEVPQEAIDCLAAVRRHHETTKARLTDVHLARLLHMSGRNWTRRKQELRGRDDKKRLGGYDWLEGVWPLTKDWHPSWERLIGKARSAAQAYEADGVLIFRRIDPAFDQHGNAVVLEYEETYDADGVFVSRRLIKPARNGTLFSHLGALAAGIAAASLLDVADGHIDGVLHWCYVLLEHIPSAILA
jgi:hypothetical protein